MMMNMHQHYAGVFSVCARDSGSENVSTVFWAAVMPGYLNIVARRFAFFHARKKFLKLLSRTMISLKCKGGRINNE